MLAKNTDMEIPTCPKGDYLISVTALRGAGQKPHVESLSGGLSEGWFVYRQRVEQLGLLWGRYPWYSDGELT